MPVPRRADGRAAVRGRDGRDRLDAGGQQHGTGGDGASGGAGGTGGSGSAGGSGGSGGSGGGLSTDALYVPMSFVPIADHSAAGGVGGLAQGSIGVLLEAHSLVASNTGGGDSPSNCSTNGAIDGADNLVFGDHSCPGTYAERLPGDRAHSENTAAARSLRWVAGRGARDDHDCVGARRIAPETRNAHHAR